MKKKANKYNNKKVIVDGIKFDSDMEARYYAHLMSLKHKNIIEDFSLQPVYELQPSFRKNGELVRAITYKADFEILHCNGTIQTVDVKGFETADFRLKAKMFAYKYPQELLLITFSKIDGGWIELDRLKEKRKERKKLKEEKGN